MASRKGTHTPVIAAKGRRVHGVTLTASRTACGLDFAGWRVGLTEKMNCHRCKLAILLGPRPRRRRRRR